ncbi:fungal specific transcription factor domain-containing protein [Phlyctema vagabunda]|uniref:Fungal specific transcription factor domain-containing protein n=1 Tax=Phlyctema vagabunda TaxID=108571 RepID=A0ABR4PBH9_9HELO
MPRPSAADTPLLRVSRPVSACSRCRAAKIKCDGKLPACTACEKSGRGNECSSANDQFAKGKERSYVASLESRVEKLERRLAYARSRKASVAMHDADEPAEESNRKDSLATIRAAIHGKAARKREVADVNELVSDFGFLSVNATTRDFESSTTNMTFARLILAATNNDTLQVSTPVQLPSRARATELVQYYLDHIFALYPVFSETALYNALDAIYQENGRPVTDFEQWLFYLVLAIASTCQSRNNQDSHYQDGLLWVGRALSYADKALMPGYVSQIQALVLLVQYSMLDPAHFDSWHLIGFACRAIVDLGFHQDPPKEQQPDKKTLDLRRRIFYSVYALDRSISMAHARAFSFTDDSTSVAYPSSSPSDSLSGMNSSIPGPQSMSAALLLFQLRWAQSSWYQELFQSSREPMRHSSSYIWQMCSDMREWSERLPDALPLAFRTLFELELLYSYIYCLAPSGRVPHVMELGKTLIFEYSIAYVEKIFPISNGSINAAFYTYHDALRVYFIGSQFIAVLSENQETLLTGIIPYIPMVPGSSPAPPIPENDSGSDNIDRSIRCIKQIKEILRTFGQRWEDSDALQSSFSMQADPLLSILYARSSHSEIARASQSPNYANQYGQVKLEAPTMDDWNNMGQIYSGSLQGSSPGHQQANGRPPIHHSYS